MSNDKENEYFSDGITEEILNALTKIGSLRVTARTSSFAFKDKNEDIRIIGELLNVSSILEGSVRKSGNKVRITAQLINVKDGFHFWSENFDRELDDIFAIQDEVAQAIAEKLREFSGHFEIDESVSLSTSPELSTYDSYLKANHLINKWDHQLCREGIEILNQVIDMEPSFAQAHCSLSNAYSFLGVSGGLLPENAFPLAKAHAQKALELDPQLSDAYTALASVFMWNEWDFQKAHENIENALMLNASDAQAHVLKGLICKITSDHKQAIKSGEQAVRLNPFDSPSLFTLGTLYFMDGQTEKALDFAEKALAIDPYFNSAITLKGMCYLLQGQRQKAIHLFSHFPTRQGPVIAHGDLSVAYAMDGQSDKAVRHLDIICDKLHKGERVTSFGQNAALTCLLLGRDKDMMELLYKGIELKAPGIIFIQLDPLWTSLRDKPEYEKLLSLIFQKRVTKLVSNSPKYSKSRINEEQALRIESLLVTEMENKQLYLDPDLSLKDLAKQIDVSSNHLSQVLNERIHANFYEFVNRYRLQTFKQKIDSGLHEKQTLLAIAYECGFSSKTTFNTFFKKATQLTPKEYIRQLN